MRDQAEKSLVYTADIPVRWGDMDSFGHVNTAVYFTYFEQARVLWWQHIGLPVSNLTTGPIVASATCDFLKPIQQPADLIVRVYAGVGRRRSFTVYYEIEVKQDPGVIYARGSTVIVWVDYRVGKSILLPDLILSHLHKPLEH